MDKALKQRLVGASVLIILAVIVLPMLLSGRSDTLKQESHEIELPPKPDELSIETRRFPVGAMTQAKPGASQTDAGTEEAKAPAATVEAATADETAVAPDPAPDTVEDDLDAAGDGPSPEPVSEPPKVTPITLSSGRQENVDTSPGEDVQPDSPRYLVQVASFSSEKNANALAERLRADRLPVLMDVVDRVAGRLHRVRVGPYAERAQADEVVDGLRSKIEDLSPRVLDLRPDDTAPVSTPSDPLVRWVVQVGSFGSEQSADSLVAELRLAGFTAFSEKVTSQAGSAFKVRIGPEINREKAVELARKVKTEHQLETFVTTME